MPNSAQPLYLVNFVSHARVIEDELGGFHQNAIKRNSPSPILGRRLRLVKRASGHNDSGKTRRLSENEIIKLRHREDQIKGALNATLIPFGMFLLSVGVFGVSMFIKDRIQKKQKKTLKDVLKDMAERRKEVEDANAMQHYIQTTKSVIHTKEQGIQQYSGYEFPEFPDSQNTQRGPENTCSGDFSIAAPEYTVHYNRSVNASTAAAPAPDPQNTCSGDFSIATPKYTLYYNNGLHATAIKP